jgi:hypothetical protein
VGRRVPGTGPELSVNIPARDSLVAAHDRDAWWCGPFEDTITELGIRAAVWEVAENDGGNRADLMLEEWDALGRGQMTSPWRGRDRDPGAESPAQLPAGLRALRAPRAADRQPRRPHLDLRGMPAHRDPRSPRPPAGRHPPALTKPGVSRASRRPPHRPYAPKPRGEPGCYSAVLQPLPGERQLEGSNPMAARPRKITAESQHAGKGLRRAPVCNRVEGSPPIAAEKSLFSCPSILCSDCS